MKQRITSGGYSGFSYRLQKRITQDITKVMATSSGGRKFQERFEEAIEYRRHSPGLDNLDTMVLELLQL